MKIDEILKKAEKGELEFCKDCPWSPKKIEAAAFGVSCLEHGFNWMAPGYANSMNIMRDPGGTTPQITGRLCAVHNSRNITDKTAQNYRKLWEAAVSLKSGELEYGGYLKKHYAANAIMHGSNEKDLKEKARLKCSEVLALQIIAVKPKVVIAMGIDAVNSLYKVGIIKRDWKMFSSTLKDGVYFETVDMWRGLQPFKVFCSYHTSAQSVNINASKLYCSNLTEKKIKEKIKQLSSDESIRYFLSEFSDISNNSHKGMRVLLSHWLDIGIEIRKNFEFEKAD